MDIVALAALGAGAALLVVGASRRSILGACLAVSSAPLLYRGINGHWPDALDGHGQDSTRNAFGGDCGVRVRESVRVQVPVAEVYRFSRRLENLPRFMTHLERVTETPGGRHSHWIAIGPDGLAVEWEVEVINEIEKTLLAWRSLPGSDISTAGTVSFETARGGRSTHVSVHFQYAPKAGQTGALVASLLGRAPSQAVRKGLRRLKQMLEAGEIPRHVAAVWTGAVISGSAEAPLSKVE